MNIKPGIVIFDGKTIYPTSLEWIISFAIKDIQWAKEALPEAIEKARHEHNLKWVGYGI